MLKEFKTFLMRGNVIDLAIAVIIGAAFSQIVNSLVEDIIMPPLGLVLGKMDFSNIFINLSEQAYPTLAAAKEAGAATINIGLFLNALVNFLIIATVIFFVVRQVNKLGKKKEEPKVASTKECPYCLSQIAIKASRCPHCTSQITPEHVEV